MSIYKMNNALVCGGRWFFPEAHCETDDIEKASRHFDEVMRSLYPGIPMYNAIHEVPADKRDLPFILLGYPYEYKKMFVTRVGETDPVRRLVVFEFSQVSP